MDNRSRSTLIQLLIGKSMIEALLVTAVAAAFFFATTNRHLRGVLDLADRESVKGWAVDEAKPSARVEVQLYIDDKFVADSLSSEFRPDVREAKRADDDWHGFSFRTPSLANGEHEARVYALYAGGSGSRISLQLIGKPLRFRIEAD